MQDCVTAVREAQSFGAPTVADDEMAQLGELGERLAVLVDTFHLYASMLERFRNADRQPPQSRPAADVANYERYLLRCRADLRRAMQDLVAALHAND
jgi:hypothetical protein